MAGGWIFSLRGEGGAADILDCPGLELDRGAGGDGCRDGDVVFAAVLDVLRDGGEGAVGGG